MPSLVEDPSAGTGGATTRRLSIKIMARGGEDEQEIGDGGFTDWTARLTADAKERCLISCVVDRAAASGGRHRVGRPGCR